MYLILHVLDEIARIIANKSSNKMTCEKQTGIVYGSMIMSFNILLFLGFCFKARGMS